MKGVIANIAPEETCIDLTHQVEPGDIQKAAIILWQSVKYFPPNTIFLCVVDPGVGSSRIPLLLETQNFKFIGPDNGVFSYVIGDEFYAWRLENPKYCLSEPRHTFHGRDIFAPAAAYAALGIKGSDFGPPTTSLVRMPEPLLSIPDKRVIIGETLYSDRFGNVLTTIGLFNFDQNYLKLSPWLGDDTSEFVEFQLSQAFLHLPNHKKLSLVRTFADVPEGECSGLLGSSGLIEIVANQKSASDILGLERGTKIELVVEYK